MKTRITLSAAMLLTGCFFPSVPPDSVPSAENPAPMPMPDGGSCADRPDEPDEMFLDTDCDGVDGKAAEALFVTPNGVDADKGTPEKPMKTLQAALQRAVVVGKNQI